MSSAGTLRSWEPDALTALTAALDQLDPPDAALRAQAQAQALADPAGWIGSRLTEHAWSKQRDILASLRDERRTAVKSCHGVGKSHIASRAAAWWLDAHPPGEAFVVTTAPTFKQVQAVLWRYIRQAHKKGLDGRVNQTEWYLDDELVAFGRKPADHDEAAFQGIHARYVLVIIDEASGVPEQLWIAADALTTNDDCRILAIGNPADPMSYFAKVCQPGSGWNVIRISAFESPNLTGEDVPPSLRALLISKNWVEEKAREWGIESPLYSEKVLGEFPQDATDQVVRSSDVAKCRIPRDAPYLPADLLPVVLGVDVGGGGDETVIRERRGRMAAREWRSRDDDTMVVVDQVLAAIDLTGATLVNVDMIGIGRGVADRLEQLRREGKHAAQVGKVNVGEGAEDPKAFARLRSQLWWEVARIMSEERMWDLSEATYQEPGHRWVSGMENADTTITQLLSPKWAPDLQGRVQVEKKEETIARLGRSPDNADALLLAFYTPAASTRSFFEQLLQEQHSA